MRKRQHLGRLHCLALLDEVQASTGHMSTREPVTATDQLSIGDVRTNGTRTAVCYNIHVAMRCS